MRVDVSSKEQWQRRSDTAICNMRRHCQQEYLVSREYPPGSRPGRARFPLPGAVRGIPTLSGFKGQWRRSDLVDTTKEGRAALSTTRAAP